MDYDSFSHLRGAVPNRGRLEFPLHPGVRIARGTLSEFSGAAGSGKTEALLSLICKHGLNRVGWIEENGLSLYPAALEERGIPLSRILFVTPPPSSPRAETLWSAQQLLRSQLFELLILSNAFSTSTFWTEVELRRLQLESERADCAVILIQNQPTPRRLSWAIQTQVHISKRHSGGLSFHVLKGTHLLPDSEPTHLIQGA